MLAFLRSVKKLYFTSVRIQYFISDMKVVQYWEFCELQVITKAKSWDSGVFSLEANVSWQEFLPFLIKQRGYAWMSKKISCNSSYSEEEFLCVV